MSYMSSGRWDKSGMVFPQSWIHATSFDPYGFLTVTPSAQKIPTENTVQTVQADLDVRWCLEDSQAQIGLMA